MIDGEKLLTKHLRSDPDLEAMGARAVGKTPEDTDGSPWIRVTLLDAPSDLAPDHLVPLYFQLDCYATDDGGQPEAVALALRARAALERLARADHTEGVVTGTEINGYARIPDTAFEPARERFMLSTTVWAHGIPT